MHRRLNRALRLGGEETCSATDAGIPSRMITSSNTLVTPRLTSRPTADELRQMVRELHRDTSFRELADKLKVAPQTLWRLSKGRKMRPSTLRRLREGLARADGATALDQLLSGLRGLLEPLTKSQRRKAEVAVALALSTFFTQQEEDVPGWVTWLAIGQRNRPRQRVERAHPAIAQVPSKVPAGRR